MKINDVILQSVSKVVVFIILTLALYLFFAGHNAPGGGFIGGLVLSSAFVLMLLASDIETVRRSIPLNFTFIGAIGAMTVVLSGLSVTIFGQPFLKQSFITVDLPFFGPTDFTSVTIFETGVALTVVGVVITIILSISKDV